MSEETQRTAQPLIEHLLELRRRLMWTIGGLLLCFLALMPFAQQLYTFVRAASDGQRCRRAASMIATDVYRAFFRAGEGNADGGFFAVAAAHTLSGMGVYRAGALSK